MLQKLMIALGLVGLVGGLAAFRDPALLNPIRPMVPQANTRSGYALPGLPYPSGNGFPVASTVSRRGPILSTIGNILGGWISPSSWIPGGNLPPGLQRQLMERGSLPPGLEKQLRERGSLPPGLARREGGYDWGGRGPRSGRPGYGSPYEIGPIINRLPLPGGQYPVIGSPNGQYPVWNGRGEDNRGRWGREREDDDHGGWRSGDDGRENGGRWNRGRAWGKHHGRGRDHDD